jgi:hypothetical protein
MSKKPRIKHGYDHDKDKMKITIRGYALSKITRDEILEKLIMQIETSPDRLQAKARKLKHSKQSDGAPKKRKVSKVVSA